MIFSLRAPFSLRIDRASEPIRTPFTPEPFEPPKKADCKVSLYFDKNRPITYAYLDLFESGSDKPKNTEKVK